MEENGKIAVVGAGVMGHGVAQVCAQTGRPVTLIDIKDEFLTAAREHIEANLQVLVGEGLLDEAAARAAGARVEYTACLTAGVADAQIVIEAIPEKFELKAALYRQLDECPNEDLIIATNTSGIPITELAKLVKRPERLIGVHFYMPAHLMPLVEIIRTEWTDGAVVERIRRFVRAIGKRGVLVEKDIPGFIGNRLQHALAREAMSLLQKGVATAADIDAVVKNSLALRLVFTGPLEQRDFNGMDTHFNIASYLYKDLENSAEPLPILREKVAQRKLGLKTGQGFYDWTGQEAAAVNAARNTQLIQLIKFLQDKTSPDQ